MNILILNTHNPFKASGIVALDLFNQLRNRGHNVKLLVNSYDKNYPDGIISMESSFSTRWKKLKEKIDWRINKLRKFIGIKGEYISDPNFSFFQINETRQLFRTTRILKTIGNKPGVIIVLYAKGFINIKNIYELHIKTRAKIFWLMFDMAPMTGGCHYAWDCKGYQSSCGSCPGLFSSDPFDITHKNLVYKKKLLDQIEINILAGSEWQYRQAKVSTLFKDKQIHKMLLPIESTVFKPVDKGRLRRDMEINENTRIIFFGAMGLTEIRKGMVYLIESLKKLRDLIFSADPDTVNNILLLVAGKGFDSIVDLLPFRSRYLGHVDNNYGIAAAYQMSDIFLCPSIEDSGPMMINQAIMCGTPVVSFEMGVSVDLVITGETGYRAKIKDSDDMAKGIYSILRLSPEDYTKMSNRCRELALQLCAPEVRIKILEDLIDE